MQSDVGIPAVLAYPQGLTRTVPLPKHSPSALATYLPGEATAARTHLSGRSTNRCPLGASVLGSYQPFDRHNLHLDNLTPT